MVGNSIKQISYFVRWELIVSVKSNLVQIPRPWTRQLDATEIVAS